MLKVFKGWLVMINLGMYVDKNEKDDTKGVKNSEHRVG